MIDTQAFKRISKAYAAYAVERRKLFATSDELLAKSKQAIFALHRDDPAAAAKLLAEVEKGLAALTKTFSAFHGLKHEGPFRAAIEEYAEAKFFFAFYERAPIGSIKEAQLDEDTILGGLSDCVGEIARKCVQWATQRQFKRIAYAEETARAIVHFLLGMNLTGYQRTKLDQSKQALRRIEDVAYDVSMHQPMHKSDFEKDAFGD